MSNLKKRLISVVSILDEMVVQSKGFKKYLPIGSPEIVVENLARWGSDEILVQCFKRSKSNNGPDFQILESIVNFKNATPIIYAGGIRDKKDALNVIKAGAERVVIGYSFFKDLNIKNLEDIANTIGRQSLILSLPTIKKKNILYVYDYINQITFKYNKINFNELKNIVSEIIITDVTNEGYYNRFDQGIFELAKKIPIPLIFFGGLNSKSKIHEIIKNNKTAAIGIGNFLNFKEHAFQIISKESKYLRNPYYEKK